MLEPMKRRGNTTVGPRGFGCWAMLLGGLMLVATPLMWTSGRAEESPKTVNDADIERALDSALWRHEFVDANGIDIECVEGVVTLKGTSRTILGKERAAEIASTIVGVRAVVNRIEVKPGITVSDEDLKDSVAEALILDPATDSYEVAVSASDGIVTLTGNVDSWQEKKLCAVVAKDVRGVREVRNEIAVVYKTERSDEEIEREIEARLANDVRVDDFLIEVEVEDGRVTLGGTAGSLSEKNRAVSDAWVAGVKSVQAPNLSIEWWARDKLRRKSLYQTRTDEQIKEAIEDAFLYDPRVVSFEPYVHVKNGVVTLTGVVDNMEAKQSAVQDARNVVGVWRVKNHLKVRPEAIPTDEDLEARISQALRRDPFVERWEIDVEVTGGWAYLSGDVSSSFEKDRAEIVAAGVQGVTAVINNVDYDYEWAWKADWEIENDIDQELYWTPFVDESEIVVHVEDGIATLRGEVDTWTERRAAASAAFRGGAKDVRNDLSVEYDG